MPDAHIAANSAPSAGAAAEDSEAVLASGAGARASQLSSKFQYEMVEAVRAIAARGGMERVRNFVAQV